MITLLTEVRSAHSSAGRKDSSGRFHQKYLSETITLWKTFTPKQLICPFILSSLQRVLQTIRKFCQYLRRIFS